MADELQSLGVSWVAEDAVRAAVVADIAATTGRMSAVAAEDAAVRLAWAALEAAEGAAANASDEAEAADAAAAAAIAGGALSATAAAAAAAQRQRRVRQAEQAVREAAAAVTAAKAAALARRQERAFAAVRESSRRDAAAATAAATAAAAAVRQVSLPESTPQSSAGSVGVRRPVSGAQALPFVVTVRAGPAPGRPPGLREANVNPADVLGRTVPANAAAGPAGAVTSDASRSRAVLDYQGGGLLPSAHQVVVSAADRRRRLVDDGDPELFALRQRRLRDGGGGAALPAFPLGLGAGGTGAAPAAAAASSAVNVRAAVKRQRRASSADSAGDAKTEPATRDGAVKREEGDAEMRSGGSAAAAQGLRRARTEAPPAAKKEEPGDRDAPATAPPALAVSAPAVRGRGKDRWAESQQQQAARAASATAVVATTAVKPEPPPSPGPAVSARPTFIDADDSGDDGCKTEDSDNDSDADEAAARHSHRRDDGNSDEEHEAHSAAGDSATPDTEPPDTRLVQLRAVPMPVVIGSRVWGRLLDYQKIGVQWMLDLHFRRQGGILGDEMGLGKTIQACVLLNALHCSGVLVGPVLIVAPLTVLSQWVAEIHVWASAMRACIMHASGSSKSSRQALLNSVARTPAIVVTTYAAVTTHYALLDRVGFQYIILDEGHRISNPDASVTIAVKTLQTPHRLILTGSPIQNTLRELWCLFDFACPGLLGQVQRFTDEFDAPIRASRNPQATPLQLTTAVECAKALRAHIGPFLLRRLKRDVNAMLPPKHERVIRCTLSDSQLAKYVEVLTSGAVGDLLRRSTHLAREFGVVGRDGRSRDGGLVSNVRGHGLTDGMRREAFRFLSQLRLICSHVDLWQLKEDDVADGGTGKGISFRSNLPVDVTGSGKLATLLRLLVAWRAAGHKVLVFSQYRMMLDIIENMVEQEGFRYIRMDGTTPSRQRGMLIDRFNSDTSVFAALLTTRVGGIGVNLTGADRVVIFDPDWNPTVDLQARERAWRIGQRREVCVYRMITTGTVEEHILHRQMAKTYITEKVLKDPSLQRFFTFTSITQALRLGAEYAHRVPRAVWNDGLVSIAGDSGGGHDIAVEIEEQLRDVELRDGDGTTVIRRVTPATGARAAGGTGCNGPRRGAASSGAVDPADNDAIEAAAIIASEEANGYAVVHDGREENSDAPLLASLLLEEGEGGAGVTRIADPFTRSLAAVTAQETLRRATVTVERQRLRDEEMHARMRREAASEAAAAPARGASFTGGGRGRGRGGRGGAR